MEYNSYHREHYTKHRRGSYYYLYGNGNCSYGLCRCNSLGSYYGKCTNNSTYFGSGYLLYGRNSYST